MSEYVLLVNGKALKVSAPPDESLLSALRERVGHGWGTKYGCGEGQCGACTVLLDGRPVRSCRTKMSEADGHQVTTIEGLAEGDRLHPVQQAFLDQEAFQCGYCTSGMIMAAAGLLRSNPDPSAEEIVRAMNGNICRCGTYPRIIAAIQQAARAAHKG